MGVKMMGVLMTMVVMMMPVLHLEAIDIHQVRQVAAQNNITCILVFGDSSVDSGNNNHLAMAPKGNFLPYGKDLPDGHPTGRFTNGRLATDFVAEALGYTTMIGAFLDPHIKKADILHGVSFASGGSGYDDLTANLSGSLSVSKQLEYFKHYKLHLKQLVGEEAAEEIISNAIVVLSMGTNDFLQNYFMEPTRCKQFNIEQYQNFLISSMSRAIKAIHGVGASRFAVVGIPPMGCAPVVRTLKDETGCDKAYNQVTLSFNSKIQTHLATLKASLGFKMAYIDIYSIILSAIQSPKTYGFTETSKGCCGSGTVEFGDSCRGLKTCSDPTKYVFWDAVHLTEKMYQIIANKVLEDVSIGMFR